MSFLYPLQLINSESDPKPTIRHAGYLLKRSNFPYTASPYKNAVVSSNTNKSAAESESTTNVKNEFAPLPLISATSSNNERLSPYNQLPFGGLDDTLEGEGKEYITQATDTTAVMSNTTLRQQPESESVEVKSSTFTDTSVADTEQDDSHDNHEICFCSPIVQCFKDIFNNQQSQNKNALTVNTDTSPQRRRSPTKRNKSSPNNRSISSPPKSPKPYNMPLKPPAKSDPMPISPAGGGERKVISAGTSKQQQQQRRRSSYGNDNSDNNIGIVSTLSTLATSSSTKEQTKKKKIYPPPPPDYIDPKDGHIWRSKYCILEEGILYFYRTAEEGESDEAFTERYESRAYSEELQDIVLGEELVFHSSISPGRRSISKEDRILNRAAHDRNMMGSGTDFLSKSPMPMKKSDMFFASPFHRQGSSVITGTSSFNSQNDAVGRRSPSSNNNNILHHSQSTSTFNHDADILWEKRVALDCVGAVRSSGQEYGENAFELLAYGSDERDNDIYGLRCEEDTTIGGPSRKNEIIDRLVLRASSVDDRNGWMFQFHRSLTSFVMQQFVNSVRTGSDAGGGGTRSRPLSPHSPAHQHLRIASGGSVSPFITGSGKQQSFATSPSGNASFGGGSAFSPHIVGSLSHGHGRNALYRRQVRDGRTSSIGSAASPMHTPTGTPAGGSSPASERGGAGKDKPLVPSSLTMIPSDSSKLQNKVELPSLRGLRDGKENDEIPSPQAPPSILRSPPKKYIPPHLRRKMEAEKAALESSGDVVEARSPVDELVPLKDQSSPKLMTLTSSESLDESFSVSATSDSSMLSRQLESSDEFISINYRLGGCADPTVIIGSISDHTYIDRKASVVGNARLEAYGGRGGGFFTSYGRHRQTQCMDEDESTLLDDLDEHISTGKHSNTRSVLKWEVGASSECGVRNSNEDSYVVINNLDELLETEGLSSFSNQDLGKTSQQGLYAIFDGHVGNQAARYSAENFHKILMEQQSVLASEDSAASYSCSIEDRAETVLREAFDRLDRDFCRLCTKDGRDWDCGATALVAFIVDDVVSLANLGDCRGVVCRLVSDATNDSDSPEMDGWEELDRDDNVVCDRASGGGSASGGKLLWKEITEDHSPLVEEERARIERANGWIIQECEIPIGQLHRMDIFDNDVVEIVKRCFADRMKTHRSDPVRQIQIARTCGDLAVSRAIGDRDFKEAYNLPPNKEQLSRSWKGPLVFIYPDGHSGKFRGDIVSNVPDVETFKVGQKGVLDEFLLMACDGLWDVMDSDDAVRIAKELLFDKKLSAKDAAYRLAELAQHLGSSDNITVIVIRFYWAEAEDD